VTFASSLMKARKSLRTLIFFGEVEERQLSK